MVEQFVQSKSQTLKIAKTLKDIILLPVPLFYLFVFLLLPLLSHNYLLVYLYAYQDRSRNHRAQVLQNVYHCQANSF